MLIVGAIEFININRALLQSDAKNKERLTSHGQRVESKKGSQYRNLRPH